MKYEGASFLIELAIILIAANLGGMIAQRLKQPSVLGQILAGLLIGPAVFNIITPNMIISSYAEIGVVLLMFLAGMGTNIDELKSSAGASLVIAIGGVIAPMIIGTIGILYIFPKEGLMGSIFVGVILSATSISITVQVLRELGKLKDKTGISILGAAVLDDILGIIILTVVIGIAEPDVGANILYVLVRMIVFFIIAGIFGRLFMVFMNKNSSEMLKNKNVGAFAIVICLLLAYIAEKFGVAAIIGAYFTGIIFSLTPYSVKVEQDVSNIAFSLFTPVFFLNIGLIINLTGLYEIIYPLSILFLIAVFSKIIGCGIGARIMKFPAKESLQIGIAMIPRGEVGLIVANIAKAGNFISDDIFTAAVLIVVLTTIVTPPMLKKAYEGRKKLKIV